MRQLAALDGWPILALAPAVMPGCRSKTPSPLCHGQVTREALWQVLRCSYGPVASRCTAAQRQARSKANEDCTPHHPHHNCLAALARMHIRKCMQQGSMRQLLLGGGAACRTLQVLNPIELPAYHHSYPATRAAAAAGEAPQYASGVTRKQPAVCTVPAPPATAAEQTV